MEKPSDNFGNYKQLHCIEKMDSKSNSNSNTKNVNANVKMDTIRSLRPGQTLALILLVVGLLGLVGVHSQPVNSALAGGRPETTLDGGLELTLVARQRAAEAELAQLLGGANKLPHLLGNARFRRQAQQTRRPFQQQQQQQQQQQLLLDDEQTIRSQLPELIAQAHNDKTVERALIKMLISASLRSALSNLQQQSGPYGLSTVNNNNNNNNNGPQQQWQEDNINDQQQYGRFTRLDQQQRANFDSLDSLSGAIDSLASGANGALGPSALVQSSALGDQYQQVDKREYIKPCSFNAVSCVRTPFRRT